MYYCRPALKRLFHWRLSIRPYYHAFHGFIFNELLSLGSTRVTLINFMSSFLPHKGLRKSTSKPGRAISLEEQPEILLKDSKDLHHKHCPLTAPVIKVSSPPMSPVSSLFEFLPCRSQRFLCGPRLWYMFIPSHVCTEFKHWLLGVKQTIMSNHYKWIAIVNERLWISFSIR